MVVLCICLGVICLFDYTKGKIPNLLLAVVLMWGLIRSSYYRGPGGLVCCVITGACVLILLYPFFRIGGLGAGDVKLLGVCTGYFSVSQIFYFLFLSMLFSAVFSVIILIKERNARERVGYFCEYCMAVLQSGKWRLYLPAKGGKAFKGVCMSGPILCSALLGLGGIY